MPTPSAPPDAAVARFRDDLTALTGTVSPEERIGIAVSGGPDSLALLLLAHAAFPRQIAAATVNHGLRPEAAAEAEMVAGICTSSRIPHAILVPDERLEAGGNVQERARMLRYALLGRWADEEKLTAILTAHHRDDVAEGFLMRALRGSGVTGLARMKPSAPLPYAQETGIMLLRPLLGWRREELAAIVTEAGLVAADDPSNRDSRYDRAAVRALIAREPLLDPEALARAARNLAETDAAIEWTVELAWRSRAETAYSGEIRIDAENLPRDIRRRIAARAIRELIPGWNGEGLDGLITKLEQGGSGTLAGVRAAGGSEWRFTSAPARRGHR